jgi:hypothetical protein
LRLYGIALLYRFLQIGPPQANHAGFYPEGFMAG